MSMMQRRKGQRGELIVCKLIADATGWPVKRRVRQHDGDSDLDGVPNWSIEVKTQENATTGDVARWWAQAVAQAGGKLPLLVYKRQRSVYRAVWPLAVQLIDQKADYWQDYNWTAETSVECWAAVARELAT